MIRLAYAAVLAFAAVVLMWSCSGMTFGHGLDPLQDYRRCNAGGAEVKRDADGRIARSSAVLVAFKRMYPCPSTGERSGACPGWNINHTIPLSQGGCDAVYNLDWMPVEIKRCGEWYCRDRWELRVYAPRTAAQETPAPAP